MKLWKIPHKQISIIINRICWLQPNKWSKRSKAEHCCNGVFFWFFDDTLGAIGPSSCDVCEKRSWIDAVLAHFGCIETTPLQAPQSKDAEKANDWHYGDSTQARQAQDTRRRRRYRVHLAKQLSHYTHIHGKALHNMQLIRLNTFRSYTKWFLRHK